MSRIEARGGIQLTLPESSDITIISVPKASRERKLNVEKEVFYPMFIDTAKVAGVIEDIKQRGEEADETSLFQAARSARDEGLTFEHFDSNVQEIIRYYLRSQGLTRKTPSILLFEKVLRRVEEEIFSTPDQEDVKIGTVPERVHF